MLKWAPLYSIVLQVQAGVVTRSPSSHPEITGCGLHKAGHVNQKKPEEDWQWSGISAGGALELELQFLFYFLQKKVI